MFLSYLFLAFRLNYTNFHPVQILIYTKKATKYVAFFIAHPTFHWCRNLD